MRGCSGGGGVWLLWGACMVALEGGHAWLLQGGHAWDTTRYGDMVNERAVCILLECILVLVIISFVPCSSADEDSLSQPQPQPGHFYYVCLKFYLCFSYMVGLIKTIINYCYWKSDWILFHSRNIDISFFG